MNSKHILFTLFVSLSAALSFGQPLIVGTYNIRMDTPKDTGNLWINRAPVVSAQIRFHEFDVVGLQEAKKNQLDDMLNALPEYQYFGVGRDDGKSKGEHAAILVRKDRFKVLNKGDFWLSETPDKPSLGWDAVCCFRVTSWVHLRDLKTKKTFFFFNAHYDHQGKKARLESSKLILAKIKEIAGKEPAILTGDLNALPDSEPYLVIARSGILNDTFKQAKLPYTNNGTFQGFGKIKDASQVIDYVFTTNHFKVEKWGILSDSYLGKYPSDHFPILVRLQ